MKKITSALLTAAICLAVHSVCNAQITAYGIKASGGASTLRFDFGRKFPTEFVPSYSFGGALNWHRNSKYRFGFEALYHQWGYSYPQSHFIVQTYSFFLPTPDTTYYTTINKATLSYVQVPVFMAYRMGKFYLEGGAFVGVAVGGKKVTGEEDRGGRSAQFNTSSKISFSDAGGGLDPTFRRFDYGLRTGAGLEMLGETLQINVFYQQGLANILPRLSGSEGGYKARQQSFGLGLTYFFKSVLRKRK